MAQEKKLIVVVGATGNQGGSVARRFLQDPRYAVRGLTRNTSSPASQALAALGVEMVTAELDDPKTLDAAFAGANIIFSVTQYWEPFFRPDSRVKAQELGITCRRYAYDVEYRQGKNIADAAAKVVDTLEDNGFLVSTLSHARKCSGGKFTDLYHFDSKADIFPDYVRENYPALAAKMSCVQTGYFMTSHAILPNSYFQKQADGSFHMRLPCSPNTLIPHLDVNGDIGNFVYAVHQMPPGKNYMAMGSHATWPEYLQAWAKAVGLPAEKAVYVQVSVDDMIADTTDRDTGVEVAMMFAYSDDPGYGGGMDLVTAEDMRKAGIECPMTSLEEWMKKQDWSAVLSK
ncbi:NAD(P)-binding protein [Neurospora hispaniola]|uniref:NAD(P)-binding protein n=1 Tax=Neurospora hispaniola TaxID=588809 RepID=A0AAJ0HYN5_9PEZI|nr:NAD(P)-binding protein [Neurospora hispaniola]